jgi:hypothetical protein
MTSEPRWKPPRSVEDLIDKNYTVYTVIYNDAISSVKDRNGRQ